jgi:hypothetical protein
VALSRPTDHGLPFSTWSLSKLADVLVAEGWSTITCHEGLRVLLREEGVSFQRLQTWNAHATRPSRSRSIASCTCTG